MNLNSTSIIKEKKIRPGRGIGSGKGKTSGRGHKGQKSRRGVAIKSFEGGQMPLYRRLPKRGFNSLRTEKIAKLNLNKLQNLIDKKTLNPDEIINIGVLKSKKIINKSYLKFKILGSGELKNKIDIEANLSSKSAQEKIEKIGGKLTIKQ